MISNAKMRHCTWCGKELGIIDARHYDRFDTCGDTECNTEVAADIRAGAAERRQADRIDGYDRDDTGYSPDY